MHGKINTQNIDVVILCGGLGTRLRPKINDRPKSLAPIGDWIFLDVLISFLAKHGIKRFILSTGYMKDKIRDHIAQKYKNDNNLLFRFSEEEHPLGTGGALKKALLLVESFPCVVVNGDSFLDVDLPHFFSFHNQRGALFSLALAPQPRPDGGQVHIDKNGKVTGFQEKTNTYGARFMNGGVYICERGAMDKMPEAEMFSLEYDLFPGLASEGLLYGFTTESEVVDIGTPERLRAAQSQLGPYFEV